MRCRGGGLASQQTDKPCGPGGSRNRVGGAEIIVNVGLTASDNWRRDGARAAMSALAVPHTASLVYTIHGCAQTPSTQPPPIQQKASRFVAGAVRYPCVTRPATSGARLMASSLGLAPSGLSSCGTRSASFSEGNFLLSYSFPDQNIPEMKFDGCVPFYVLPTTTL